MAETKIDLKHDFSESGPRKMLCLLKTLFHLILSVHFAIVYGLGIYIYMHITEKQKENRWIFIAYTYFPAYLTLWNLTFQTAFLGLALIHDVLRWLDKHESKLGKKIKYFRDVVFNGLVFPFTCFVTCMFWCVYLIDRELVFPEVYDQIVPWWLNHCVHTNIFIVITIETLLTRRRQPTDVKLERWLYGFVSVFYAVVYYSIYFFGGCWLYGVFGIMTWWQVCLYQAGIWISTWVFYHMNFIINKMIHQEQESEPKSKPNGDLESRETTFQTKNDVANGSDLKESNLDKNGNGFVESGKENKAFESNDNGAENGKEWKSIGANVSEADETELNKPFDKSWSTKYRTNRNQFDKSSL